MRKVSLGYNAVPALAEKGVLDVFRSGQYSPAGNVRAFEQAWASAHQARHAVFVNSGTDALRLSLMALKEKHGWRDGAKVVVPALTFVATVNVILQAGLRPVVVDVEGDHGHWTIDEFRLMDVVVKGGVVGMIPVHLFGGDVDPNVFADAERNGVKVLEDSCETILNELKGDVSCYSTYMAHHVTTGVGGMAVTDDDELNLLIRSYANHGRNVAYLPGYTPSMFDEKPREGLWLKNQIRKRFQFERVGYSSRGTEFEAALGLSQMAGLKETLYQRKRVALSLLDGLMVYRNELELPHERHNGRHTWMMFPIVVREGLDRDKICLGLEEAGIETRPMMPITNQPCYRGWLNENDFPVAKRVNRDGFYIPCHQGMTGDEIGWVVKTLGGLVEKESVGHLTKTQ